jgi:hypothetical protein
VENQKPEDKMTKPLIHTNTNLSDEELAKEAADYLAKSAPLQAMAQFLGRQREILLHTVSPEAAQEIDWLTLDEVRKTFPATTRMQALVSRPDIRQHITTELTGLRPKAARGKDPEFQAKLIDSAIDDGDIGLPEFESAFDPKDLVVYMDVSSFWKHFMNESLARIIEENTSREKEFFAFILNVFLQNRNSLKPILTHLDVRSAIPGDTWQNRIPLEKRVAVDTARLEQERKSASRPFTAKQELEIVSLQVIVDSLDLTDMVPILQAAGSTMGFNESNPEILFGDDDLEDLHAVESSDNAESKPPTLAETIADDSKKA